VFCWLFGVWGFFFFGGLVFGWFFFLGFFLGGGGVVVVFFFFFFFFGWGGGGVVFLVGVGLFFCGFFFFFFLCGVFFFWGFFVFFFWVVGCGVFFFFGGGTFFFFFGGFGFFFFGWGGFFFFWGFCWVFGWGRFLDFFRLHSLLPQIVPLPCRSSSWGFFRIDKGSFPSLFPGARCVRPRPSNFPSDPFFVLPFFPQMKFFFAVSTSSVSTLDHTPRPASSASVKGDESCHRGDRYFGAFPPPPFLFPRSFLSGPSLQPLRSGMAYPDQVFFSCHVFSQVNSPRVLSPLPRCCPPSSPPSLLPPAALLRAPQNFQARLV